MIADFDLIELLSAKMCHDMAGPIGAVNNGIELLLEDKGNIKDRAATLIQDSAKEAVVRLQFFRYIYGTLPPVGEANLEHLKNLTTQVFVGGKTIIDWPDSHTNASAISISHKLGKITLNMIYIMSGILIHGGKIAIRLHKLPNGKRITIHGAGTGLKVDDVFLQLLADKMDHITINSRNVQMVYAMKYCKQSGVDVTLDQKAETVELILDQTK